jgi:tRNA-guanine family transglycosylase
MLPDDGGAFSNRWRLHVTKEEFRDDPSPVSTVCSCELCRTGYARAYLHHLFWAKELLAYRLASVHNLSVMERLMEEIREEIGKKRIRRVRERWMG